MTSVPNFTFTNFTKTEPSPVVGSKPILTGIMKIRTADKEIGTLEFTVDGIKLTLIEHPAPLEIKTSAGQALTIIDDKDAWSKASKLADAVAKTSQKSAVARATELSSVADEIARPSRLERPPTSRSHPLPPRPFLRT